MRRVVCVLLVPVVAGLLAVIVLGPEKLAYHYYLFWFRHSPRSIEQGVQAPSGPQRRALEDFLATQDGHESLLRLLMEEAGGESRIVPDGARIGWIHLFQPPTHHTGGLTGASAHRPPQETARRRALLSCLALTGGEGFRLPELPGARFEFPAGLPDPRTQTGFCVVWTDAAARDDLRDGVSSAKPELVEEEYREFFEELAAWERALGPGR